MTTINCVSVLGGWQTQTETGFKFGPVFNQSTALWNWQESHISRSARCSEWGSAKGARRVSSLTTADKARINSEQLVFMLDCPSVNGCTVRKIIKVNGRFYARMPSASDSGQVII